MGREAAVLRIPKVGPRYLSVTTTISLGHPKACIFHTQRKMKKLVLDVADQLNLSPKCAQATRSTIFSWVRGHVRVATGRLTPGKLKRLQEAQALLDSAVKNTRWELRRCSDKDCVQEWVTEQMQANKPPYGYLYARPM